MQVGNTGWGFDLQPTGSSVAVGGIGVFVGGTGVLEGSSVAVGSLGVLVGPPGVLDGGGLEPPPESSVGVGVLVRKKNGELVGVGVVEGVSSPPPKRLVGIGVGVSIAAAVASSTLIVPATAV